jgi:ferritin-like metal-binding protein YciE
MLLGSETGSPLDRSSWARGILTKERAMKFETMEDLFLGEIQDLYDAEQRLVEALPGMAEAATSEELRQAFEKHLGETEGHVARLEQIFAQMGKDPESTTCDAMKGLIKEGESIIDDIDESPLRDAGLIAAANRVEHYEIAAYGSARTFAQTLGLTAAATLLAQTLQEEKMADQKLTEIAQGMVNNEALRAGNMQAR